MSMIDEAVFNERKTELEEVFDELVAIFIDEAQASIPQIEAALHGGDVDQVRIVAHSLKSSSAYLGATSLSELAAEFEIAARENALVGLDGRVPALSVKVAATIDALHGLNGSALSRSPTPLPRAQPA